VFQLLRDGLAQLPVLAELDLDDHEPVAPALESPQPEEGEAAVHVVVRDLALDEQELARGRVVRDEDLLEGELLAVVDVANRLHEPADVAALEDAMRPACVHSHLAVAAGWPGLLR